jgi:hypothetical protein
LTVAWEQSQSSNGAELTGSEQQRDREDILALLRTPCGLERKREREGHRRIKERSSSCTAARDSGIKERIKEGGKIRASHSSTGEYRVMDTLAHHEHARTLWSREQSADHFRIMLNKVFGSG